jgi:hypothetical protein
LIDIGSKSLMMKKNKKYRSAITGQYVPMAHAILNPFTTVAETVTNGKKPKTKAKR